MIKLLVIENCTKDLRRCLELLRFINEKIEIVSAMSAKEALILINQQNVDGMLVEVDLVGMDGLSLVKHVRNLDQYYFLPVLIVSGTDNDQPETYKKYHNFDYISKPYSREDFLTIAALFIENIKKLKKFHNAVSARKIVFRSETALVQVKYSDLLFAKIKNRKVHIVTRNNIHVYPGITLRNLITEINDDSFVMCSKSEAVNTTNIEKIIHTKFAAKSWTIYFAGEKDITCQLSMKNKKSIESLLKKNR